jgi:glycosyltransferase involved in cell wall biosynthesis
MSGGIRVISIYARAMADRGHDVFLVSVPRRKIPWMRKIRSFVGGHGWPVNPGTASHLDGIGLNYRVLERHRPPTDDDVPDADVVIATWWETAEWVNALSDSKGAKIYFIQHHEVHNHLPVELSRASYSLPLHKIVIARWLKDVMRDEYGDSEVDIVPNSVDHDQFFAEPRGKQPLPTLGFLYTPIKFKGVDVTLRAIDNLRARFPGLRVIAFGLYQPGDVLDSRTEFHFLPAQETIREIYARCDVWVTASRIEGFNLPAMEAMACRTPVVSTKAGWPEEAVVNGENGYLVEVDDVDALTERIESVLSLADEDWRRMSQNACDTVRDSSWKNSADMFESALSHGCQRARRGEVGGRCEISELS